MDAAIIDAKDTELVRVFRMLENQEPQNEIDGLYLSLANMIAEFSDLNEIIYDKNSEEQTKIIKTAGILMNNEIYSHSFTQI